MEVSEPKAHLVLLGLELSPSQCALFESRGVRLHRDVSIEGLVALTSSPACPMVVAVGIDDPVRALRIRERFEADLASRGAKLILAADDPCPTACSRAGLAGYRRLYPWPHCAIQQIVQWLKPAIGRMPRRASRIPVGQAFSKGACRKLIDISTGGACVELSPSDEPPELLWITVRIPGVELETSVVGIKVWSESRSDALRVGIRFCQTAPGFQRLISELAEQSLYFPCGPEPGEVRTIAPVRAERCAYDAATVIFHRLELSARRFELLRKAGAEIVRSRSVEKTLAAVAEAKGLRIVVIDLGSGGGAPERLVKELQSAQRAENETPPITLGCHVRRLTRRSVSLGLPYVLSWPEGVYQELTELLRAVPSARFRRSSWRAPLGHGVIRTSGAGPLPARIVNVSGSGALVETEQESKTGDLIQLEVSLPGVQAPAHVEGEVIWTDRSKGSHQLGVRFRKLSNEARRMLEDYAWRMNVLAGVKTTDAAALKTILVRAQAEGTKRQDYFGLVGDFPGDAVLVPKKPFLPPYRKGTRLIVRVHKGDKVERLAEVLDRVMLDGERINGRVGWKIRTIPDPAAESGDT